MHPDWRAFLESCGARIGDDGAAHFDSAAASADCALTDLSTFGLISVSGPEAGDFLQGQLSNDLRELSETHSQLSSHCSPKGRMLANFRVLRLGERILLVLPRVQVAALRKRLQMFLLRRDAVIEDLSDELVCFGAIGVCADTAFSDRFGRLPELPNAMVQRDDAALIRAAGETPRLLFIGPPASAAALWQEAGAAGAAPADPDLWALHEIRAGIPTVLPETADAFVPQMANMQLIDGVSFHKGCYTGQEVVARMQYLGRLKRRMYHARVDGGTPPRPGMALTRTGGDGTEPAPGRVVDARAGAPGEWELLVVAEIAAAEGGGLRLGDDGPVLELSAPPYGFPAEA
jgi:folate-binding protein YgfZ